MPNGDAQPIQIQLPLVVVGADEVPLLYSNFFQCAHLQDEIILNMGSIAPPVLLGTPEQQLQQAQQVGYVTAKLVARYAFTRTRLQELIGVLNGGLANYDQAHGGR